MYVRFCCIIFLQLNGYRCVHKEETFFHWKLSSEPNSPWKITANACKYEKLHQAFRWTYSLRSIVVRNMREQCFSKVRHLNLGFIAVLAYCWQFLFTTEDFDSKRQILLQIPILTCQHKNSNKLDPKSLINFCIHHKDMMTSFFRCRATDLLIVVPVYYFSLRFVVHILSEYNRRRA